MLRLKDSNAANPPLALLRAASKRYGTRLGLDAVSLDIRAGETLALLGANGAGKTTALGLLTGRLRADAGEVRLFGGDPQDPAMRRGIGVMLQEAQLADTLRVAEHVRLFSSYYAAPRPVEESLHLAGLGDLARRPYGELSGGQQRRVQFALAICGRPPLLFVDEPTVGLDVESRRGFWQVMRTLRAEGTAIVLTTHYLQEADALADRVVVLAHGRVLAEDTPAGIKARAAGTEVSARSRLPIQQIEAWPECERVEWVDERTRVHTADALAVLRRWMAADAALAELEVRPLDLESAFLRLTAASRSKVPQSDEVLA